ncbi:type IV pilus biogenesis/stability protein PilW [Massilia sp. CF038]|uniref:type IV pilus biogenesis/stability protein PilW n=1 Tax=Massilia sp. CF038 TaxID=1881045 RepID=UPI000911B042|nr:type IV pilus biogenesis/stability protein PilW [Massilia sp. CF038]SHG53608.1 type IV pilus assembly protein PilF [Massilia sp. CF038]
MKARIASGLALCVLAGVLSACAGGKGAAGNNDLAGSKSELKTASDATSADKRASIRLQLAVGYYQNGNYEVALDEVKMALAARPEYSDAFSVRALVYTAMGEMALAEENHQRAIALAPRNPELNNNYGQFLCQVGRYELGMAQLEMALKNPLYQSPVLAKVNAGTCATKMKNYDLAERYLMDALRYEPDMPAIQAAMARVYFERRDYERAGFFITRLNTMMKPENMSAEVLWLSIRVYRKLGDKATESTLATQLRRRHPGSPEFAAFMRGAFDE